MRKSNVATPDKPKNIFRVIIGAPIQDVWNEITRRDRPIACFFNSRMCLGPGGLTPGTKMAMRTPNGRYTGVVGQIIECSPPRRLSHTFQFTSLEEPPCVVQYDLQEVEGGTEFTLTILEAVPGSKTEKQMTQGAALITATLKGMLERGKPPLSTRFIFLLMKVMEPFTPKRCLSERWPVG